MATISGGWRSARVSPSEESALPAAAAALEPLLAAAADPADGDAREKGHGGPRAKRASIAPLRGGGRPCGRALRSLRSFFRSLLVVDHTSLAFVPPLRTATIMMVEMFLIGIGNDRSTAFRLGALYVGLADPGTSLGRRLRYMGLTAFFVVTFGALMPWLTWGWDSAAATAGVSFAMAALTGLSPLLGSPALFLAMKLGLALYAVNGGVNKSTGGHGGCLGCSIYWTFLGAASSLALALAPEIVGNRDAVRTDLFKSLRGFGMGLRRWGKDWGTAAHLNRRPIPTVTLAISATKSRIARDDVEEADAKEWLLKIMQGADTLRVAGLCMSNSLVPLAGERARTGDVDREADAFARALGRALTRVALALHFPWIIRYTPCLRNGARRSVDAVAEAAAALIRVGCDDDEDGNNGWLAAIVRLILAEMQSIADLALDGGAWPPYAPPSRLFARARAAFPTSSPALDEDPDWAIRGFALRLAIAFTLAMIPELVIPTGGVGAHWFPMTVALIMLPKKAATYEKVIHRVMGTLLGLGFGSMLVPLFKYPEVLIVLLGLTTYATVIFITANYALFTFFVTGWVYVTSIGAGASKLASTTLYRCCWTLAAGALVMVVMLTQRPKTKDDLGGLLANFAKLSRELAEALLERNRLRRLCSEEDRESEEDSAAKEGANAKIDQIRVSLTRARTKMLARINEAALSPSEGYSVDPHSLAPWLAADLTNALVILHTVYLVPMEARIVSCRMSTNLLCPSSSVLRNDWSHRAA